MHVSQTTFRGEAPRLSPRLLPATAAQNATNARMQSGDLETWRQYSVEHALVMTAPVMTIYRLNGAWLSWAGDVAVARGPVPGDTTFRTILAGPDVYAQPQLTTYAMATSGAEPYPVATRPLGVPAPDLPVHSIYVRASAVEPATVTSYVFTYVNDLGQESAPSPVADTDFAPHPFRTAIYAPSGNGDYNAITVPALSSGVPSAYGINTVRLYRAATGATGTVFRFVIESAFTGASLSLVDNFADTSLGEVLQTELWDLPPDDLQGIIALPNGVVAGFTRNQLCLSVQNYPHAYPVAWRLTTDTDIVGIGNIDTTIVIFTKSFPYLAIGTDPSQYSMTKLETEQAGTSRRSIASILGMGVVGATPDGLFTVLGNGQIQNMTSTLFTRRQWQALVPESITCAVHNDIYFFSYDTGASNGKGSFALDMKPDGFGLVPLSSHASAAYSDPITDELYLVLDSTTKIINALLPIPDTMPTVSGTVIYRFDPDDGAGLMMRRYYGKLNLLPRPAAFGFAQVKASDYTNLVLRLFGDGALYYEVVVAGKEAFTLPVNDEYESFEYELLGTSTVRSVTFAESIDELNESGT